VALSSNKLLFKDKAALSLQYIHVSFISLLGVEQMKYNLEEYFGFDVQVKVIYLEFFILSIQLDSPMLS
jgi:hypothetical protein